MRPGRSQSGRSDPELHITLAGIRAEGWQSPAAIGAFGGVPPQRAIPMHHIRSLASFAPLFLGSALLLAQAPSWSPDWATAGLGGTVYSLADYGGEAYAGGVWFEAKGGVIRGLARFDGADWRPVGGGVDLINYSFPPKQTRVAAMTVFNGELVFAGTFDRVGAQAINYIARWDGATVRPLGAGLRLTFDEADVRGLAVYNNELYAAGDFDLAGSTPVAGIARWNGTTWSAVGTGLRHSINGTAGVGRCLAVHSGALVVGGEFDRAGGVVVNNLARWNGTAWSGLGAGSFAPVYALAVHGTQLVAAGQFQLAGGAVAMPGAWNGATWTAMGANAPTTPSVALCSVGTHLYADTGAALARYDGSGWTMAGLVNGIFSGVEGTSIRALHAFGGELWVGGEFTRAGSTPNQLAVASASVVAFDGVNGWRSLGGGQGLGNHAVRMLPWRNGLVAAGMGDAGAAASTGLAFYDGDRWSAIGRFSGGNGGVSDGAVYQGDLIVTGSFAQIDGQPFPGIARFDGAQWHPFGPLAPVRLHAHGSDLFGYGFGALQRWNGTTFAIAATPTTGGIDQLYTHQDGLLYIANNDAFNHRMLVWNGVSLQTIGTANDFIQTIGGFGAEVVIGGRFTAINGVPAVLMARWNGAAWRSMPAPVSGYSVYAFGELDGDLYAGVSGDPRGYCLKLSGGTWQTLGAGLGSVPTLLFADRAVGSMLASGDFFAAASLPAHHLAEWRTQPAWRNRLHGTPGAAGTPLLRGGGTVQVGSPLTWTVEAPANLPLLFGGGASRIDLPLFGMMLVPLPEVVVSLATDAQGNATLTLPVPTTLPPGIDLFSQVWVFDGTGPQGITATNALQCTTS